MANTPLLETSMASLSLSDSNSTKSYDPSSQGTTPLLKNDESDPFMQAWDELRAEKPPVQWKESNAKRKYLQKSILDKIDDDCLDYRQRSLHYGITPTQPIASLFRRANIKQCDYTTHLQGLWNGVSMFDTTNKSIDQSVYSRIEPSLRLATEWLTDSEPFYVKTLFADIQYDPVAEDIQWLDPSYEQNDYDRSTYLGLLPFLLERTTFLMGTVTNHKIRREECCAHGMCTLHFVKDSFFVTVQLNESYLNFFSRPDYEALDSKLKRRVEFLFATAIGHEMAHVMMHLRRILHQPILMPLKVEPTYDLKHPERELGHAWQEWMFGGIFGTIGNSEEDLEDPDHLMRTKTIVRMNWKNLVRFGDDELGYSPDVEDDILNEFFETGNTDLCRFGLAHLRVRAQFQQLNYISTSTNRD